MAEGTWAEALTDRASWHVRRGCRRRVANARSVRDLSSDDGHGQFGEIQRARWTIRSSQICIFWLGQHQDRLDRGIVGLRTRAALCCAEPMPFTTAKNRPGKLDRLP
jgi:hypothetical protein